MGGRKKGVDLHHSAHPNRKERKKRGRGRHHQTLRSKAFAMPPLHCRGNLAPPSLPSPSFPLHNRVQWKKRRRRQWHFPKSRRGEGEGGGSRRAGRLWSRTKTEKNREEVKEEGGEEEKSGKTWLKGKGGAKRIDCRGGGLVGTTAQLEKEREQEAKGWRGGALSSLPKRLFK